MHDLERINEKNGVEKYTLSYKTRKICKDAEEEEEEEAENVCDTRALCMYIHTKLFSHPHPHTHIHLHTSIITAHTITSAYIMC